MQNIETIYSEFVDSEQYKQAYEKNYLNGAYQTLEDKLDQSGPLGFRDIEDNVSDIACSFEKFGFVNGFKLAMQIAMDCAPETSAERLRKAFPPGADPMDANKAMAIIKELPVPWDELDNLNAMCKFKDEVYGAISCFQYGRIQGIREEHARRKGGASK